MTKLRFLDTGADVLHFCGHKCPDCDYCCSLEVGHAGPHATEHGNMSNTVFVADGKDVDVGDRRYNLVCWSGAKVL